MKYSYREATITGQTQVFIKIVKDSLWSKHLGFWTLHDSIRMQFLYNVKDHNKTTTANKTRHDIQKLTTGTMTTPQTVFDFELLTDKSTQ